MRWRSANVVTFNVLTLVPILILILKKCLRSAAHLCRRSLSLTCMTDIGNRVRQRAQEYTVTGWLFTAGFAVFFTLVACVVLAFAFHKRQHMWPLRVRSVALTHIAIVSVAVATIGACSQVQQIGKDAR